MGRFNVLPEYSETADKFKTTDPGHADVFNDRMQILLNNDKYIKEKAVGGQNYARIYSISWRYRYQ